MQSKPGKEKWLDISTIPDEEGREDQQAGWQQYVGWLFWWCKILDVGAGLGKSRERLARNENTVTLQDVAPGLPVDITDPIETIPDKSYDLVTAFDVIEHVDDDLDFMFHLCRIARKWVFISTPNFNVSRAINQRHVREYTPDEFVALAKRFSDEVDCFIGNSEGTDISRAFSNDYSGHPCPHHAVRLVIE